MLTHVKPLLIVTQGNTKSELRTSLCMISSFKFSSSHPTGGGLSSISLGSSNDDFRFDLCSSFGSNTRYVLSTYTTSSYMLSKVIYLLSLNIIENSGSKDPAYVTFSAACEI